MFYNNILRTLVFFLFCSTNANSRRFRTFNSTYGPGFFVRFRLTDHKNITCVSNCRDKDREAETRRCGYRLYICVLLLISWSDFKLKCVPIRLMQIYLKKICSYSANVNVNLFKNTKWLHKSPNAKLKPTTTRLRALRSADWARRAQYFYLPKCFKIRQGNAYVSMRTARPAVSLCSVRCV